MNKFIGQVITSALAVSFLWGILGVIVEGRTQSTGWAIPLLAVVGGVTTWLFIYITFIIKEA